MSTSLHLILKTILVVVHRFRTMHGDIPAMIVMSPATYRTLCEQEEKEVCEVADIPIKIYDYCAEGSIHAVDSKMLSILEHPPKEGYWHLN